jgi:predicted ArsR family transcriptional regulator
MQSTRERILDFLNHHGRASAHQMARAFGMTGANLRHHLIILREHGLIEILGESPAEGRGRREQLYALSDAAKPQNLQLLAGILLGEYGRTDLPKQTAARLRRLAKRLSAGAQPIRGHITQRLVAAVSRLTELAYQPRWEAQPQAPQIVLGHCPYAAIIADHPELCKMDALLLQELVGEKAEQLTKMKPGPNGLPECVFAVKQ